MTKFMISRFEKRGGERSPEYMHSNERDKIIKSNQNSSQNPIIISDSSSESESESSEDSDFDEWIEDESDSDSITSFETNENDKETERGNEENLENVDFEELSRLRNHSVQKLRTSWERIIKQYGNKRGQIENQNQNQNQNLASQKANIEALPAIGQSWTRAHSVVPPLTRFQGSAGFMIAPEWQILPSSEDGEEGISEDEEDDEDVIDFEAKDWEKKLQNTSYFVERAERSPGICDRKSKGKRSGTDSSICSETAPERPLPKRQRMENEQTCEITNSPENLNGEIQHCMPVSIKEVAIQCSPEEDNQLEENALKTSSLKHSHQKDVTQTRNSQENVAQANDHQVEVVQENDRHKDIALQQSFIKRDVRKDVVRQYSSSKDQQQRENHRSKTSSPKRQEKKSQQQQKIITNFMTSFKPNLQMSSTSLTQCKGRNQCTKSFCLICGSVSGIGTGL